MAQFARPNSDVIYAMLGATPVDTAGNRHQNIDESTPSDTDYIYSANNPGGGNLSEFGLSSVTDPAVGTGHILRIRCFQIDEDSGSHPMGSNTSGTATTLAWELLQGATIIASGNINPGVAATSEITLSGTEADAITNYADLRIELNPGGGAGSPANRRGVAISWVELEVPDAAANYAPALINNPAAAFAPTVTPGPVNYAPALLDQTAAAFSPAIANLLSISLGLVDQTASAFTPTVSPGAVGYSPALISQAATPFSPSLSSVAVIAPPLIDQTAATFDPNISQPSGVTWYGWSATYDNTITQDVSLGQIDQTAAPSEPTVTVASTAGVGFIDQTAVAFNPTVTPGVATISLASIDQTATASSPTVTSSVAISLGLISQDAQAFTPTVIPGATTISLGLIEQQAAAFTPAITSPTAQSVQLPVIDQAAATFSPTVRHAQRGRGGHFGPRYVIGPKPLPEDQFIGFAIIAVNAQAFTPRVERSDDEALLGLSDEDLLVLV